MAIGGRGVRANQRPRACPRDRSLTLNMKHVIWYMLDVEQAELSKLLFGRAGRLRLARWIIDSVPVGEFFFQGAAREGAGDVISEVRANLDNFERLEMIKTAHRDPGPGRRQYYQRLESEMWSIFERALDLVNVEEQRNHARRGR
jgi:hypothetical protein